MYRPRFSTLLLATILLWVLGYVLWVTNFLTVPQTFPLDLSLRGIPVFVFGVVLCLAAGRLLAKGHASGGRRFLVAIAVASVIVATFLFAVFYELVIHVIAPRWGGPSWNDIAQQLPMASWLFITWMLLYFALVADAARRDREVQLAQATAATIQAQHQLLVQQINPHFLFNTLNTISSFVSSQPEEARNLISELAALLRDSIRDTDSEYSSLGHEYEMVKKYLRIISVRFGERFRPSMDVPESLQTQPLPRGLLLALSENAVTHGVSVRAGECGLSVHCASRNRSLVVEVCNHYDPRIPESSGHRGGLAALDTRLRALYGDAYRLEYGGDATGLWRVRVELPSVPAEAGRAPAGRVGGLARGGVPHPVSP